MQVITRHSMRRGQWRHLADDETLASGRITVSLQRWRSQREILSARFRPVGVRLGPDDAVAELGADLDRLALVALEFGPLAEGRGYSQARQLRERYRYRGELRALGARRDHLYFMARCGIDAFELQPGEDCAAALAELRRSATTYQPAADGRPLVFHVRRRGQGGRRPDAERGAGRG